MVNKNHKCYDNDSLLLTLKLIRRITISHAKRDYTFSLFTPPQNGKGELIMGMIDNINDSITSHRIVDNNLKTELIEIEYKYSNKEEMISYLDQTIGFTQIEENNRRINDMKEIKEKQNKIMYNEYDYVFNFEEDDEDDKISINLKESISPKEIIKPFPIEKNEISSISIKRIYLNDEYQTTTKIKKIVKKCKSTKENEIEIQNLVNVNTDKINEIKDELLYEIYHFRKRKGEIKINIPFVHSIHK